MIFLASLFGAPCAKNKKFFCGPAFGASRFLFWGSVLGALFGSRVVPRCLDLALKQGTKQNVWGHEF
jgi:hypothetical protein